MQKGTVTRRVETRDRQIFTWIQERVQETGRFPTVRQIAEGVRLSSVSQVDAALKRMEAQGLLLREGRYRRIAEQPRRKGIPILGTVAAGVPLLAEECIEGWLPMDAGKAQEHPLFALRVRGDSMIGAGILEGDLVVLEQTAAVDNGDIAAVWLEEGATVKRFFREKDRVRLQPENPRLEPIYVKECTLLGRVVALVRNYE